MADQSAASESSFRMPANAHEFAALALSLIVVFALVQVGAPIIRELDFLDQKLRDYFVGVSFAAFPIVHRQCKRGLAGLTAQQAAARHDLAPWFVSGVLAAALLFAWNQFVSFLGGVAMGLALGQLAQGVNLDNVDVSSAVMMSIMVVSLPMSAIAAMFAGVLLNRHTRSHTFAALALGAACFVAFNALTNWLLEPAMVEANWKSAASQGEVGVIAFVVGLFLVGFIIFAFGALGVFISRLKRERTIGRLMEAARHLPPAEREDLADEIARRAAGQDGPTTPLGNLAPVSRTVGAAEP